MFQLSKQDKTSERSNLPDKEFKITVMKMLTELWRRMDKHNDNLNKDIKYKKIPNRNYN